MIFGHGDDAYLYGGKVRMNFSSNIYCHADLSGLKSHLASRLDVISSYPEPEPTRLEQLIAERLDIPDQAVMVTSGATEAISLIAQLFRYDVSIIPQPTFSEYADACRVNGHVISYESDEEAEGLTGGRVYWICSPNNPTGHVMPKELLTHIIRQFRQYVYVIDQSYEDYTLRPVLKPSEMLNCRNLLILHSMTKKYCIPGLRLGYVTGSPVLIDRLRELRQPWSVNALAIEAGLYLLENDINVLPDMSWYLEEADRLKRTIMEQTGMLILDTDTPFMLVHMQRGNAAELKEFLVNRYGILIRNASNFEGLSKRHFRIAAQAPEENDLLIEALTDYVKTVERSLKRDVSPAP